MRWAFWGALLAALAVAAGAFAAHGLRGRLDPRALELFETAARYQLIHAFAAAFAGERSARGSRPAGLAAGLFIGGIALFSGSLDALALGAPRTVGLVTPFGGLAFIAGWVALAASFRGGPRGT